MEGLYCLPESYRLSACFLQRLRRTTEAESRRKALDIASIRSSPCRTEQLADRKRLFRGRLHPTELSMPRDVAANLLEIPQKEFPLTATTSGKNSLVLHSVTDCPCTSRVGTVDTARTTKTTTHTPNALGSASTSLLAETLVRQDSTAFFCLTWIGRRISCQNHS